MDASKLPPYAIVALVPFLWFAICQLLGFLSGWRRLGEPYPHSGQVPGGVMDFASATMGFTRAPSVRFRLAGEHPEILRLATGRPGA